MNIFNKALLIVTVTILSATLSNAQTKNKQIQTQKVVIQLSSNDTLVHRSVIKQLHHIKKAVKNVTIEVVTHEYHSLRTSPCDYQAKRRLELY